MENNLENNVSNNLERRLDRSETSIDDNKAATIIR